MGTAGKVFDVRGGKAGKNSNKASDDKRHVKTARVEKCCPWYGREFASCTVDEGHDFRNQNAGWYAVLEVMKVSKMRMVSTATPLYTSPKVRAVLDSPASSRLTHRPAGLVQHRPSPSHSVLRWPYR